MSAALLSILMATSEQTMSQNYPADPIPSSWPKKQMILLLLNLQGALVQSIS